MFDICNRNESIETDDTLTKKERKTVIFNFSCNAKYRVDHQ